MKQQEKNIKEFLCNEGYTEKEIEEFSLTTGCDLMFLYDIVIQKYQ